MPTDFLVFLIKYISKTEMQSKLGFSAILVISIRTQRLQDCLSRLVRSTANIDIPVVHVNSVHGDTLNLQELVSANKIRNSLDPAVPNLTRGQVGCFMSHLNAWKYIVDNHLDNALILEDDVNLSLEQFITDIWDHKRRILENAVEKHHYKWDILFLGRNERVAAIKKRLNEHLVIPGMTWGLFCYAVQYSAANYLVKLCSTQPITEAVDTWLSSSPLVRKKLYFMAFDPSLVAIVPVVSDTVHIK
jgi:GR25 family glycosyltransferase involved in LPS biosynthesis